MTEESSAHKGKGFADRNRTLFYIIGALFFLYLFLVSIGLMSTAFKLFGEGFAEALIRSCASPVAGLFIGIFATSLIQSSSTTTALTVGFVGGGVLPLEFAIPIIMGANIGTTITNIIVSFGFVARKEDFRRAFAGATVHDFFNLFSLLVFFPLEIHFHLIQKSATALTAVFGAAGGGKFASPVKMATKPVCDFLEHIFTNKAPMSDLIAGVALLAIALTVLIFSLVMLVKNMRKVIVHRAERYINRYLFRNDFTALVLGLCVTMIVQSSSVTTSLVVPLVGAGVISLSRCFPFTLGANIGTTVTALLASLATISAGESGYAGVTAAFAHLLFNIFGMLVFYPLRALPMSCARKLADLATESKRWAIIFILGSFFGLPLLIIILMQKG